MLNVNISAEAKQILESLAAQNGQSVADFAGKILEKEAARNASTNGNHSQNTEQADADTNPLMAFAGMFSSGKTDTSERMSDLLREENLDPAEGFSIR